MSASHDQQPAAPPSRAAVAGVVSFYLVAAITMVIANKWVLNTTKVPLFFLFVQLVIAVLLLWASHALRVLRVPQFNIHTAKGLWQLIAVNVAGLSFNNYCLKYVDASFYQVARGLVLPITVAISYFVLHSRPSKPVLAACAIVCLGFFAGVKPGEAAPSSIGVFFGILSSITTALHAVVIKRSLEVVDGSAMDLAYYSNLLSAAAFVPLIVLVGELPDVLELLLASPPAEFRTFVWGGLITGVFGFLICIAGFLSIKVTSPITHMVSAAVRGVLMALLGYWFFADALTSGRIFSISLILLGSVLYTWFKNQEARAVAATHASQNYTPLSSVVTQGVQESKGGDVMFDADARSPTRSGAGGRRSGELPR